ncbi:hypothetical protein M0R45_034031 [Rubus argutus]|uniref:NAC domain-containing protein n=1 Tax=Rubus argutus TaxID=59490 RepID=A0AAW1VTE1_RUBAR
MSKAKTTPLPVPVGYRFHPTDEELVNYYLQKKIQGNDSEINDTILEIDVCNYDPTELPALLGTEHDVEWFFFTRKHYKYHNSDRSNRCTKEGYWKITGKEREIKDRRSKAVVGKKKTLTFYRGRVPKSKKTGWVIHECSLPGNEAISYQKQAQGGFVICRLKCKLDKKDSSICDGGQPSSSHVMFNCENQAADVMIQEGQENGELLLYPPPTLDDCCSSALQSPTSLELGDVLQANGTNDDCNELQSPFGDENSCARDKNGVSTRDEDETMYDVLTELCDPPEKNLDSLFRPIQPQDYSSSTLQSPMYTLQSPICREWGNVPPQDYQPTILQSPIYTNLENVPQANVYYGECNKWQFAFKKTSSTNEVDIPDRHIVSNSENQATNYRTLEVFPQTEGNLESSFYPFQPQDSMLQPLMYTNFGDALQNIECNELQSRLWGQ